MSGADVPVGGGGFGGSGAMGGRGSTTAPVELIDIIFALSNISLVREIVKDNLSQLEALAAVGKGQTEGLRTMIMQKQKQVFADLTDIEKTLQSIVDRSAMPVEQRQPDRNFNLNTQQSKALVYAVSFSISHLMKFVPGAGGPQVPGVII